MPLDSDPAGGERTRDAGSFWFGSDANPDAVRFDTDGNAAFDGDVAVTGTLAFAGDVTFESGVLILGDVSEAPAAPTSGVILYSESGVLKCVDPTEAVTQLAPPEA